MGRRVPILLLHRSGSEQIPLSAVMRKPHRALDSRIHAGPPTTRPLTRKVVALTMGGGHFHMITAPRHDVAAGGPVANLLAGTVSLIVGPASRVRVSSAPICSARTSTMSLG